MNEILLSFGFEEKKIILRFLSNTCGTHRKGVEKMSEKKTVQTICLVAREEDGQVKVRFLFARSKRARVYPCSSRGDVKCKRELCVFCFFFARVKR